MKRNKIVSGMLCVSFLVQNFVGVGVIGYADDTISGSESSEVIPSSLTESFGISLEELTESTIEVQSTESSNSEEASPEVSTSETDIKDSTEESMNSIEEDATSATELITSEKKSSDTIIAEEKYGSLEWYLTKDNQLVLLGGTLPEVAAYTNSVSPWHSYSASIHTIDIQDTIVATAYGAEALFANLTQLEEIKGLDNLDLSQAVSVRSLFQYTALKTLDLTGLSFSNVVDISYIFSNNEKLTKIILGNFKNTPFTSVYGAFSGLNLENLDLSNWNTSNVESLGGLFSSSKIKYLDVSGWDLENVVSVDSLFYNADIEAIIGMEDWYLPNLNSANSAFYQSTFKNLDLSNWQPELMKYMGDMFRDSAIETLSLANWNTENLYYSYYENKNIFKDTKNLTTLTLGEKTRFSNQDYNHQSIKNYYDQWIGSKSEKVYDYTTSLLSYYERIEQETFTRKATVLYQVVFDQYSTQEVLEGSLVSIPTAPTRAGYTFDGWYEDLKFTTLFKFSTPITSNRTLYAKWLPIANTVTFDSKGGTAVTSQSVLTGETVILPKEPTKKGYLFDGWYLNEWADLRYDFSTPIEGEIKLFARWNAILTFETNGGGSIPQQAFNNISLFPKEPSNPVKKGYTFKGWYRDKEFKKLFNFGSGEQLTESTTLYAKWQKNITNLNQYGKISNQKYKLFEDEALKKDITSKYSLMNRIIHITQSFLSDTGETVYLISDNKQTLGYMKATDIQLVNGPQGVEQNYGKYVILNGKQTIWSDFNWSKKVDANAYKNKTIYAKEIYNHFNGTSYLSLYNNQNKLIGYIDVVGVTVANGQQGIYQSYGKYVMLNGKQTIWRDFNWSKKIDLTPYKNKTLQARGIYYHFNGSSYLSLYDNQGKWVGYIDAIGANVASGKQGNYQSYGKYVTIKSNSYAIWKNFGWSSKASGDFAGKTYLAKGIYYHFNGSSYLSLYDNQGKWVGYINAGGAKVAKGKQGTYQTYNKYVTVKSNSYAIWKNFGWSSKASGKFAGKTYLAKGIYRHFNGSSYLSLYDSNNKWIGYINQNGTKAGSSQQEKFKKVQDLLNKEFKNQNLGIYVMSLVDGSTAQINGNKQFHAASTGKLPALYYTQKMILEKKVDGNKLLTYTDAINQMPGAYMRGGAGVLQSQPYGKKFSLNTIMNWTAKYSDNQGTNFLAYYASNKYDAAMKKEISTIMGRNWTAPFYVNAKDNAMMLEAIYNQGGKLITDMSNTVYDNQRIPKYIPVQVAHKIGDVNDLRHDAGIIYSKEPYVLSVLTQNYQSYEKISVLSKKIYDILK